MNDAEKVKIYEKALTGIVGSYVIGEYGSHRLKLTDWADLAEKIQDIA